MGVPPQFVGAANSNGLTYATAETGGKELLRDTLGIYFEEFDQTFSLAFPRGTNVKFNRDSFTRASQLERFQAYQLGVDIGMLDPEEPRQWENLAPKKPSNSGLDDGDIPTAYTQKQINKTLPISQEGIKQILGNYVGGKLDVTAEPGNAPAAAPAPVQAQATRLPAPPQIGTGVRAAQIWEYWTGPQGFARYARSVNPWESLRDSLISEVPPSQADDLATTIMMATPEGRLLFAGQRTGGH
jgi:hypothetical protein